MARSVITFQKPISFLSGAAVVGGLEGQGPLCSSFDLVCEDSKFGMDTWEKAESEMVRQASEVALKKGKISSNNLDLIFAGDLTNQCAASSFGLKEQNVPYIGLYGACSTFALSLGMGAVAIEAGLGERVMCAASSHFASAERQYRFPLEYGCQRTPTAQTTVTGCGCVILCDEPVNSVRITEFFPGIIEDFGIDDPANMGAAMAPACANTLLRYFSATGTVPEQFDMIITGDLGMEGQKILKELLYSHGIDIRKNSYDCGNMIFDFQKQSVHSGGSGCGCSAAVFSGTVLNQLQNGKLSDILLIGTGALLSAGTVLQNETIPGIAHLIRIQKEK